MEGASDPVFVILVVMTIYLLYNTGTPAEQWANNALEELKRNQVTAELLDADSPRGIQVAEYYDIMARPAIIILKDDGTPIQVWQGEDSLPLLTDVVYYSHS